MSSQSHPEVASTTVHSNPTEGVTQSHPAEGLPSLPIPTQAQTGVELTSLPPSSRHGVTAQNLETTGTESTIPVYSMAEHSNSPPEPSLAPPIERKETEAIGPATESAAVQPVAGSTALQITLLLSSGSRHPFKIDEKYLKKRNVDVEDMSPLNISVYTMKELIWKDWRSEWEPRPLSPAYIRLIFFGAMLDDKNALKDCRFNTAAPNVVHMSVKPQEIVEEEDVKPSAKKSARRGSETERQGSRCCIIL